jgi:2-polyprenyl-3-methyl-5-hydroxy-6-metoxy-1,4-benzoquinol methylase
MEINSFKKTGSPGAESSSGNSPEYYQFEDINYAIIGLLREARSHRSESDSVLDLGCGRARLGLEVQRLGYQVTGIDSSATACNTARTRITEVLELNLADQERVASALGERRFDWLVAADVLEHFPDPLEVLRFYRRFLKAEGRLIVSLPNVAVWDNRLRVVFGRFDYRDSGVMDRTHLRFFTFRTARELIEQGGFAPIRTTFEPGIARAFTGLARSSVGANHDPAAIIDSPSYQFYVRYALPLERAVCWLAPRLLAFRVVVLASLKDHVTEPRIRQSRS